LHAGIHDILCNLFAACACCPRRQVDIIHGDIATIPTVIVRVSTTTANTHTGFSFRARLGIRKYALHIWTATKGAPIYITVRKSRGYKPIIGHEGKVSIMSHFYNSCAGKKFPDKQQDLPGNLII
jgi:hypothetical protein